MESARKYFRHFEWGILLLMLWNLKYFFFFFLTGPVRGCAVFFSLSHFYFVIMIYNMLIIEFQAHSALTHTHLQIIRASPPPNPSSHPIDPFSSGPDQLLGTVTISHCYSLPCYVYIPHMRDCFVFDFPCNWLHSEWYPPDSAMFK